MKRILLLSAAVFSLLWSATAHAQLEFTFQPPQQSGGAGDLLTFSALLQNVGATELFLDTICFTVPDELSLDDEKFFTNTPLSLAPAGNPGDSFLGEIFDITIAPSALPGQYTGTFIIDCQANGGAGLATQNFQVTVTGSSAIPEAGSLTLVLGGLLSLSVFTLRCRQRPVRYFAQPKQTRIPR